MQLWKVNYALHANQAQSDSASAHVELPDVQIFSTWIKLLDAKLHLIRKQFHPAPPKSKPFAAQGRENIKKAIQFLMYAAIYQVTLVLDNFCFAFVCSSKYISEICHLRQYVERIGTLRNMMHQDKKIYPGLQIFLVVLFSSWMSLSKNYLWGNKVGSTFICTREKWPVYHACDMMRRDKTNKQTQSESYI
jgi:hypothetical protein